ncbi:MAG: hypothetical protein A2X48_14300 [Lentisphaerae bacterium GWF2_49_21]|nr:MAG: hypothetical protein A2X48_14300 [Lentisphaerae bacterium GWF2_49_21]
MHIPVITENSTPSDIDIVKFASSLSRALPQIIEANRIDTVFFNESFLEYIFLPPTNNYQMKLDFACPRYLFNKLGISNSPINQYLHRKEIDFINRFNKYTAPTSAIANLAANYYNLESKMITIIPNAVNTALFHPLPNPVETPKIGICFAGRFSREKGADVVIEIMPGLLKKYSNLHFSVAGSSAIDECRKSKIDCLKKKIEELGCLDRFCWSPCMPYGKMPDFYRAHSIFISPTMFESFGNSIAEAQACGLPVVASKVGGVPEVVQDRKTGFLENMSDNSGFYEKLKILIEDTRLRYDMGKAAVGMTMQNFSFSAVYSRLEALLR